VEHAETLPAGTLLEMRAMVLHTPAPAAERPLQWGECPRPQPGPGDLLIQVAACGVCRTDLQLAEGDLALRKDSVVPGHQIVGRVVEMGSEVTGWCEGDRVGVAWLAGACGTCAFCSTGRENLCREARFTGWDRDGGYAEMACVDADFALRIPDEFSDIEAAPLLCGGVIGFRALRVSGIIPGGRLGLYGFGASALLAMQVALHWGCEVYVATRSESERTRARDMGAVWTGNYDTPPPQALDAAVTFAPSGEVVTHALRALDRGGTVAINAIHLDSMPAFDYEHLWWERSLRSVANFTRQDARDFLALASEIPIVTTVEAHPLKDANTALARLAAGSVAGAAVLTPNHEVPGTT
jgi:alcohol dehydrogenase, propanol-preferring